MKWWKNAWTISTSILAAILSAIAIYGGVSEIGYIHTPKQLQEKQELEALEEDLHQLQLDMYLLQHKTPEIDKTTQK